MKKINTGSKSKNTIEKPEYATKYVFSERGVTLDDLFQPLPSLQQTQMSPVVSRLWILAFLTACCFIDKRGPLFSFVCLMLLLTNVHLLTVFPLNPPLRFTAAGWPEVLLQLVQNKKTFPLPYYNHSAMPLFLVPSLE